MDLLYRCHTLIILHLISNLHKISSWAFITMKGVIAEGSINVGSSPWHWNWWNVLLNDQILFFVFIWRSFFYHLVRRNFLKAFQIIFKAYKNCWVTLEIRCRMFSFKFFFHFKMSSFSGIPGLNKRTKLRILVMPIQLVFGSRWF